MRVRLTVFLLGLALCACVQAQKPTDVEFLNSGKVIPKSLPFSEAVRVGDTSDDDVGLPKSWEPPVDQLPAA